MGAVNPISRLLHLLQMGTFSCATRDRIGRRRATPGWDAASTKRATLTRSGDPRSLRSELGPVSAHGRAGGAGPLESRWVCRLRRASVLTMSADVRRSVMSTTRENAGDEGDSPWYFPHGTGSAGRSAASGAVSQKPGIGHGRAHDRQGRSRTARASVRTAAATGHAVPEGVCGATLGRAQLCTVGSRCPARRGCSRSAQMPSRPAVACPADTAWLSQGSASGSRPASWRGRRRHGDSGRRGNRWTGRPGAVCHGRRQQAAGSGRS